MASAPHGRSAGFSLIEILVVIVIIGIVLSIAILSVSLVGGDKAIREEAQRMMALLDVARDESMLQGREFGLELMIGGYRFVELDPISGQWNEIIGDDTLRQRELPEELEIQLYIEDRPVILKPLSLRLFSPSLRLFSLRLALTSPFRPFIKTRLWPSLYTRTPR